MTVDVDPGTGLYAFADRIVRALEFVAITIATIFLLTTMVLISLDALLRYALNRPLSFQMTLTEDYLLLGLVVMALAWGFRTGGYIRIDAVTIMLPNRARVTLLRLGLLASTGYTAVLCWQSWHHFWDAFTSGAVKFGVIDYPAWLSHIWIPVGLGLLAARLLLMTVGPSANLDLIDDEAKELQEREL